MVEKLSFFGQPFWDLGSASELLIELNQKWTYLFFRQWLGLLFATGAVLDILRNCCQFFDRVYFSVFGVTTQRQVGEQFAHVIIEVVL